MSFAEKTRATLAEGKANRGIKQPKPDSNAAKLYNYWLSRSKTKRASAIRGGWRKENFCHYWRVVALWAPLTFFREVGVKVLSSPITGIVAIAAVVLGFVWAFLTVDSFGIFILQCLAVLAGAVVLIGVILGIWVLADYIPRRFPKFAGKVERIAKSGKFWLGVAVLGLLGVIVGTSGTSIVAYVGWLVTLAAIAAIGFGIVRLLDYYEGKNALRQAEWDALDWDTKNEIMNYLRAVRKQTPEPGRVAKFFTALGNGIFEFVEFVVQVVRVNKWKICPLVEIPKETQDA